MTRPAFLTPRARPEACLGSSALLMRRDAAESQVKVVAAQHIQCGNRLRSEDPRRVRVEHPDPVRVTHQLLQPRDDKRSPNAGPLRHTGTVKIARSIPHNHFLRSVWI